MSRLYNTKLVMAKRHAYFQGEQPKGLPEKHIKIHFEDGTLVFDGDAPLDQLTPEILFDERINRYRCPAHEYRIALANLLRNEHAVHDLARTYSDRMFDLDLEFDPYPHQAEALDAWTTQGKRGMVVLPTGAGKSFVAKLCIQHAARSALVVAPTLDLVDQWARNLEEAFQCEIGLLAGGVNEPKELTVATYDSAAIHMERLGGRFGLVIFDEAHHLPSPVYKYIALASIAPFRLGLTATPERADGSHSEYDLLVGPTVYRREINDLSGDILAEYRTKTVEVPMSEEDAAYYASERKIYLNFIRANGIRMGGKHGWSNFLRATSQSEAGRRALAAHRNQKRTALAHSNKVDAVVELLVEHRDERTIVFANDNQTVYDLSERTLLPALTHQTPIKERKQILERFRSGEYATLITSRVLNEGVDVPEASMAIILSGTGSVREHVQRLGRILRRQPGKEAILYEMVTADSVETDVSLRRREHDAYR